MVDNFVDEKDRLNLFDRLDKKKILEIQKLQPAFPNLYSVERRARVREGNV